MNLGKNIIEGRKEAKISQEALAELMGVSRQTISNWELEETYPTSDQLVKLAKIFKKSTDELLSLNVENIFLGKVEETTKLVKKQIKFTKILFITIYLIILAILIFITIHFLTLKDFTKEYQGSFTCDIANDDMYKAIQVDLIINGDSQDNKDEETAEKLNKDPFYKALITEVHQSGWQDEYYLNLGYSYKEAIDSLNYIKRVILDNGGTCR